ncbi:phenylalanine--tRNA ligase subunit alpha [Acidocella sp.]|uniref:phenylalanine--tRNA ligase subunit alpha n=1 Tax=Acidocella sp. TaxID=50710 RepID=UPI003CFC177C
MQSDDLKNLVEAALPAIAAAGAAALEELRVSLLGKNGSITALLKSLGGMEPEARKAAGAEINRIKAQITDALSARRAVLDSQALERQLAGERIDVTQPPRPDLAGAMHPLSRTQEELAAIFATMGFSIAEGPDIESDWNNFSALNIPAHHPARAMMDTFYLQAPEHARPPVLRTHTSPVQIRTMLNWAKTEGLGATPAPIRIIVPGRTFRADHDATHSPMFHQCEGLVIGEGITLGHLKGCLIDFLRAYFGVPELPVRFRASYFPFTEPSMEVDIGWSRKTGEIGGGTDWLEILGSGMIHANVLANCGIDPRRFQGFAFGVGLERITMLKHGIADLRLFYESDVRWLRHYGASPLTPASLHEGI